MKRRFCVAVLALSTAALLSAQEPRVAQVESGGPRGSSEVQQGPFTNDDVITMVRGGFAKETIIAAIRTHGRDFDTSLDGLMGLREAGVDEEIIREILAAASASVERTPDADRSEDAEGSDGLPTGNGVYVVVDGRHELLAVEPIEWRSPFWAGRTTVGALTTARLNARLPGLHSPFVIGAHPEVLVVCAECETGLEYHLVRAHDDEDKREFHVSFQVLRGRNETWIAQGGQKGARVPFQAERLAPGKFRLSLPDLEPNDFAFLPPSRGADPQSLATSVMYTFYYQPGFHRTPRLTADTRAPATSADMTDDPASLRRNLTVTLLGPNDDVEEEENGKLVFDDGDIDLGEVTVGLRFPNIAIPPGATIVSAHVQFTAESDDDEETSILIRAESTANAAGFRNRNANLTSRSFTRSSVSWSPGRWEKGDTGPAQRTPNLAGVLQEVVSQPDWNPGNTVVFMLDGRGQRDAEAYDFDEPTRAARLLVTYSLDVPPTEP